MDDTLKHCSFCSAPQSPSTPLIAGSEGHICEACVRLANQVVTSWGRKRSLPGLQSPLPTPQEMKHKLDEYIIGQDLAKEILSVAVYNHYKRFSHDAVAKEIANSSDAVELAKSNVLLLGPTGSGKTLLASTLARIVGVPFAIADATTLTQAGYVGDDVDTILSRLLDVAEGNVAKAEWGIIYIDEIDKLARSNESSMGVRDVSGEGVQQALLKLVEGAEVKLSAKGGRREKDDSTIDTSNILFIVGGAFAGIENVIESRVRADSVGIGFHSDVDQEKDEITAQDVIMHLEQADLRRFGLIPEFIGRFPVIAMLDELDEDALLKILTQPRNALVKQYKKLFEFDDVELVFSDAALLHIAHTARSRKTGARGLRGEIEKVLRRAMFEVPGLKPACCLVDLVGEEIEIQYEYRTAEGTAEREVSKLEAQNNSDDMVDISQTGQG